MQHIRGGMPFIGPTKVALAFQLAGILHSFASQRDSHSFFYLKKHKQREKMLVMGRDEVKIIGHEDK